MKFDAHYCLDHPEDAADEIERLRALLREMLPYVTGLAGIDGEPFTDRIDDVLEHRN
jgi:hypothetical protein